MTQESEKEDQSDSTPQPLPEGSPVESTSSESVEREASVEVIRWIPASAGNVIQIPGGQGSQQFSIQLHHDGQVVDVPVYESETVNCLAMLHFTYV